MNELTIERDPNGIITNAASLGALVVANQPVLCPACKHKVFKSWPTGWEAHAEFVCTGIGAQMSEGRKAEFKSRFGHLMR